MDKRFLISVGVISALLFGLFCVFPLSWALSDDKKMKDDENLVRSFPMLDRNRKKRMAIEAGIRIGISILSFAVSNIRKSFDNSRTKKSHQELISHFEQIHEQLEQQKEELESINQEIQKLGSYVIYFQHESKIEDSLLTLREYLTNSNERNRNIFINKVADVDDSIRVLIDGLLGQNTFGPDIMAIIQEATKCHGLKLRKSVHSVESLVMTGLYVRREYQRIAINATEFLKESPFKKYIDTSLIKLEKRLNDKVVECYADEKNVGVEMASILKATLTQSREVAADSLLEFLEEKYDNKKWIVILQRNNTRYLDSVWTGGFHQATVENHVVLALSVDQDRNFTKFKNLIQFHLKEFSIPTKSSVSYDLVRDCLGSLKTEEYLKRFLIPVLVKSGIEIETVVSVDTRPQNDLIIKTSKEVEEQQVIPLNNMSYIPQSCLYKDSDINRFYCNPSYWMILIPTKRLRNPTKCSHSSDNETLQDYGPLRNEYNQAYLSVKGDSDKEGAPIILDREWKNSPGQNWKFVNGQLRNGFGKCFTKWSQGSSHSIYQYDCHHNWEGQKWSRHGLQIIADGNVAGYTYCVSLYGNFNKNSYVNRVPMIGSCNSLPSYLWYNRNTDCEDAMVIPPSANGSRALRNEFSRLFLSADDKFGMVKPWINRPSQLWKFVDGLLRNEDGKCLVGKGWYVEKVACDSGRMGNNGLWTYTENRQIRSYDGYCLSNGDEETYVYYDYCRDEPQQRWRDN